MKTWHESDENGTYRRRTKNELRSPDKWIFAPVPDCGLERSAVDRARANLKSRARKPSGAAKRSWELSGGIARCAECGSVLSAHTVISGDGHRRENHYYSCRSRYNGATKDCPNRHSNRADDLEARVWEALSSVFAEEQVKKAITVHFDDVADFWRRMVDDLGTEMRLHDRLAKLETRRSNLIDLAADGTITRDDLREKLAALDEERQAIRGELDKITGAREELRRIASLRDDLLAAS